jgi:hypothetical protein
LYSVSTIGLLDTPRPPTRDSRFDFQPGRQFTPDRLLLQMLYPSFPHECIAGFILWPLPLWRGKGKSKVAAKNQPRW